VTERPVRVELVTTDGLFELDGGTWEVTNNIWLVGDEREAVVIDAAHDHGPIVERLAGRRARAIVLTHGHNDHINAAVALRAVVDAPVYLHPADRMLWDAVYPGEAPDRHLEDHQVIDVAGVKLEVLHTPGHSPGSCCLHMAPSYRPDAPVVFSGDTLFCGGPGATGRKYSDERTILASIEQRLLTLPGQTVVHTGHGESTTVEAEAPGIRALLEQRAGAGPGP
jgi:glyoxylase-like metal-dependent hydrolase (beta-lactamase superfamily II)